MTFQIPDTLVLCGVELNVESPGISPSSHPLVDDVTKYKPEGPRPPSLMKSSALHRGYMASWEIGEDGSSAPSVLCWRVVTRPHAITLFVFIPLGRRDGAAFTMDRASNFSGRLGKPSLPFGSA